MSSCSCKGIRYCKLCEKLRVFYDENQKIQRNDDLLGNIKIYNWCLICKIAYPEEIEHKCGSNDQFMESKKFDIEGMDTFLDFISPQEEDFLMHQIDRNHWVVSQSGRLKQDYGPRANFKKKKVKTIGFTGLPDYSKFIYERLQKIDLMAGYIPVELCNLDYAESRGSCIDPHIDDSWIWGDRIGTISLLEDTFYTMTHDELPFIKIRLPIPRYALTVLHGEARMKWKHSVERQDIGKRRVGIALRELAKEFLDFESNSESSKTGKEIVDIALTFAGKPLVSKDTEANSKKTKNIAQIKMSNNSEKELIEEKELSQIRLKNSLDMTEAYDITMGLSLAYCIIMDEINSKRLFQLCESQFNYYSGRHSQVKIFGKWHYIPRKQVAFGDPGLCYKFSGNEISALPWTPLTNKIRQWVQLVTGVNFNFVLVNRYNNGNDYIGEHQDNEKDLDPKSPITALSLGEEREFILRHESLRTKKNKSKMTLSSESDTVDASNDKITIKNELFALENCKTNDEQSLIKITLQSGSLLIMHPPTQEKWYHSLPRRKNVNGSRISLTFRNILSKE